ncbi:hypothetical protein ACFYY2_12170 [Streptomyces sp. NPDC001822]|uniref:hypothetical protein n=1 Tax=Streptomyces sp. NPDC001822 TaxID=3364614 RepID=UPI0036A4FCA2
MREKFRRELDGYREDIREGDQVTHHTHPNEVGEVVRAQPVRTGGTIFHVVWPGGTYSVPYPSTSALTKYEGEL